MSVLDEAIILNNGSLMPKLGISVDAETDLSAALKMGYRLFSMSSTQIPALKKAVDNNHILLPQIYLQLNLNASLKEQDIASFVSQQLQLLGAANLNLVLLPQNDDDKQNIANWRVLEKMRQQGRIKNIGLSDFYQDKLESLLAEAKIKPILDHLNVADPQLISYLNEKNILLEQDQLPSEEKQLADLAKQEKQKPEQLLLAYNLEAHKITLLSNAADLKTDRQLTLALNSAQRSQITAALNK